MNNALSLHVASSHPCLPGHFPGNAIVPGVLILNLVTESILARHPGCRAVSFPRVKFLSPVTPETEFILTWKSRPDGFIDFYCDNGNLRLVQGRIQIEETP